MRGNRDPRRRTDFSREDNNPRKRQHIEDRHSSDRRGSGRSFSNNNSNSNTNYSQGSSGGRSDERESDGVYRDDRQLFIGNVVAPNVNEVDVKDFLNKTLRDHGIIERGEADPITACRLSGKYGFLDFLHANECTKSLVLNGVPYRGSNLKIGRPAKYNGPIKTAMSWQEFMMSKNQYRSNKIVVNQNAAVVVNTNNPAAFQLVGDPATRSYREIFIGQTNNDLSDNDLRDFLGNALLKLGMSNSGFENPVMEVRNSGKFAFAVMRTVEDAANIMNLTGIPVKGSILRIERPSKFDGAIAGVSFYQWDELYALWLGGELKLLTSGNPTKVIRITNMIDSDELNNQGFYGPFIEELKSECGQYGYVKSVVIPKPLAFAGGIQYSEKDIGKVFVEMNSIDEAKSLLLGLKGRVFNNRTVDIKFYPEDKFRAMNYSVETQGTIVTASYGPVFKEQVYSATALSKIWASAANNS